MSQRFNIGPILAAMLLIAITVAVATVVTTHHIAAQLFFQGPPGQDGTQGPPGTTAQATNLTVRNAPGSVVPTTGLAQTDSE
jgi:hypothetical protein